MVGRGSSDMRPATIGSGGWGARMHTHHAASTNCSHQVRKQLAQAVQPGKVQQAQQGQPLKRVACPGC